MFVLQNTSETRALLFHENRALSFPKKGTFSPGTKSGGGGGELGHNAPPPPGSAASVTQVFKFQSSSHECIHTGQAEKLLDHSGS